MNATALAKSQLDEIKQTLELDRLRVTDLSLYEGEETGAVYAAPDGVRMGTFIGSSEGTVARIEAGAQLTVQEIAIEDVEEDVTRLTSTEPGSRGRRRRGLD